MTRYVEQGRRDWSAAFDAAAQQREEVGVMPAVKGQAIVVRWGGLDVDAVYERFDPQKYPDTPHVIRFVRNAYGEVSGKYAVSAWRVAFLGCAGVVL